MWLLFLATPVFFFVFFSLKLHGCHIALALREGQALLPERSKALEVIQSNNASCSSTLPECLYASVYTAYPFHVISRQKKSIYIYISVRDITTLQIEQIMGSKLIQIQIQI